MSRISMSLRFRRARQVLLPTVAAACLGVLGLTLSSSAAVAGGDGHGTIYVNHSAMATAPGTSCATAQYASVQSAVNAASNGARIYLCGSVPYTESVVIENKDLTLTGDDGATIQAPADALAPTSFFSSQGLVTPNSIVTVIGSSDVSIVGLTIEGPFQNSGCGGDDFGVLQIGGTLQLRSDSVLDIGAANQADLGGCQYGVGVQIGRRYWPSTTGSYDVVDFAGDAQVHDTTVAGYQKNGITVDGPGSQAQIQGSSVDGGGPNPAIARNGIQISRGATAQVLNSTIGDNEYTGPGADAPATGVLVFGGCGDPLVVGAQIHNNTLANDDAAIDVSNTQPDCASPPTSTTNIQVHNNTISKADGETNVSPFQDVLGHSYTGYQVGIADTGNGDRIHNNSITGTVVGGVDTAFGPQTAPGGPFLVPIDIQTYPPVAVSVHNNTYDGQATSPPY